LSTEAELSHKELKIYVLESDRGAIAAEKNIENPVLYILEKNGKLESLKNEKTW